MRHSDYRYLLGRENENLQSRITFFWCGVGEGYKANVMLAQYLIFFHIIGTGTDTSEAKLVSC